MGYFCEKFHFSWVFCRKNADGACKFEKKFVSLHPQRQYGVPKRTCKSCFGESRDLVALSCRRATSVAPSVECDCNFVGRNEKQREPVTTCDQLYYQDMAKKNDIVKAKQASLQPLENIENLIHVIRGKQVMLDRDLARLYGVETRVLNQAVQRNIERFPEDFMFQLSKDEVESLRSQFVMLNDGSQNLKSQNVISNEDFLRSQIVTLEKKDMRGKHLKYLPYAFTENGVAIPSALSL